MTKDKLTLKSEIQKDFNNETVKNINIAIKISKVMKFLYSESTIFIASLIPFLVTLIYLLPNVDFGVLASAGIMLMVSHFLLYKFFYSKVLFKDAKVVYGEFKYTIEVLNEIKLEKSK